MKKSKRGKKMNYQARKIGPGLVSGQVATRVESNPPTVGCIDGFIGRTQEHNQMLARLIERTQAVGDRMFGGRPEEKDGADQAGPSNMLGILETALMTSEQLATRLLEQISRLEVL